MVLGGKHWLIRGLLLMAALALLIWLVRAAIVGWTPSRDQYAVQGVHIGAEQGAVEWTRLAAMGVDFVYLDATLGAEKRAPHFQSQLKAVRDAGIRFGAVHHFDLCRLAGDQANLFLTTVPRQHNGLPPAIWFDFDEHCTDRPARTVVLSEIATMLSEIETHVGKPAIVGVSPEFEEMYQLSRAVNRTFWVEGNFFPPDYIAKPYVMWTANNLRHIDGVDGPVEWLVVR